MPLYDYRCANCGAVTEIRHGFNDTHAEPCGACGGVLSRVFNPAPIVFKGSGFYVTDSRPSSSSSADSSNSSTTPKSDSPKSDSAKSESSKSDSAA
jgi:putative FmdB family regulatory protein